MLATRIIPTLLHRGHTLVKGKQFNSWRSIGNVMQAAKIYAARGVDELCILNIGATPNNEGPAFELVKQLTEDNFTPITVGGGIKSIEDVEGLLMAGADKICIGKSARSNQRLIWQISDRYGSQALVMSMDVTDGVVLCERGNVLVEFNPIQLAKDYESLGTGEILLTSIDREGTMSGYDLELINEVSNAVDIPIIAHGGCSGYEDMYNAIKAGASAVAAGALFAFTDCTPKGAAEYLKQKGVEVRL